LDLGPRRHRFILAVLALEVNQSVPLARLVELNWPASPPRTAAHAVMVSVSSLRTTLADAGFGRADVELVRQGSGYLLRTDPSSVDVHRFETLLGQARSASADDEKLALLDHALRLWSGPALDGTAPASTRERLCRSLEEARLTATEDRFDIQLRGGRHAEILGELSRLVDTNPLRERLIGQLMLSLYRCGRTGEALAAYRSARALLATELGLDPGPPLQQLELAILRSDPAIAAPATAHDSRPTRISLAGREPRQLPPAVADFTGREAEIGRLNGLLPGPPEAGAPVVISAVAGSAGVGKTALTVYWAHRVRHLFPDGQLYVDLRGYGGGPPVSPLNAVSHILHSLGVPAEQVPGELDAAAATYRTVLAGRRVLVLLDNARDAEQVRPLLPGDPGCLVVVTSRDRLSGLVARNAARRLVLDVLTPGEAHELLSRALGAGRVDAEPAAADQLAAMCARLPLALRIAAGHLTDRPGLSIADYVARLSRDDRLAALQVDGDPQTAVRAAFEMSVQALPEAVQRMFRLLGLAPGPDFTAAAAAALADCPLDQAALLLDRLCAVHLVDQHRTGRFSFHDLLRRCAAEQCAARETAAERAEASHRLLTFYLNGADAAARRSYPHMQRLPQAVRADPAAPGERFDTNAAALAWLDAERPNLVAAVRHAASHGPRRMAWLLADALRGYLWLRRHTIDWLSVAEGALAAASEEKDELGQALAHLSLAQAVRRQSLAEASITHYLRAGDLAKRAGWLDGEAAALSSLADLYRNQGRLAEAAETCVRACACYARATASNGAAAAHCNLGHIYADLGRLGQAASQYQRSIEICAEIGSELGGAVVQAALGDLLGRQERYQEGLAALEQARTAMRRFGIREGEADTLAKLAWLHNRAGRPAEAVPLAQAAADLAREVPTDLIRVDALNALGTSHTRLGRPERAARHHGEARDLAHDIGYRLGEITAHIGLAGSALGRGRYDEAIRCAGQALDLARTAGLRLSEADALTILADAARIRGHHDESRRYTEQACAIHHESDHIPPSRPAGDRRTPAAAAGRP
jgi:DNA-binding SARP family transcriptional activator/tetratricopeptide (TPR) repeat protein